MTNGIRPIQPVTPKVATTPASTTVTFPSTTVTYESELDLDALGIGETSIFDITTVDFLSIEMRIATGTWDAAEVSLKVSLAGDLFVFIPRDHRIIEGPGIEEMFEVADFKFLALDVTNAEGSTGTADITIYGWTREEGPDTDTLQRTVRLDTNTLGIQGTEAIYDIIEVDWVSMRARNVGGGAFSTAIVTPTFSTSLNQNTFQPHPTDTRALDGSLPRLELLDLNVQSWSFMALDVTTVEVTPVSSADISVYGYTNEDSAAFEQGPRIVPVLSPNQGLLLVTGVNTATSNTIFTAPALPDDGVWDLVTIRAWNKDSVDVLLTQEILAAASNPTQVIPAQSGPWVVLHQFALRNSETIKVFASTGSVIELQIDVQRNFGGLPS